MTLLIKQALIPLLLLFFSLDRSPAQFNPGVERWEIKTSLAEHPVKRNVSINELLALPNPIEEYDNKFESVRIPDEVTGKGLKEGDMVTTTAWLHLVALEKDSKKHRDGDYHIQLRNSPAWGDSCFIVEVPFPDFVEDADLRGSCRVVREFVKSKLLKGKEPSTRSTIMEREVYVTVTGQLFFDAPHMKGNLRGKKKMKSYTPWELHPVTSMRFARKTPR